MRPELEPSNFEKSGLKMFSSRFPKRNSGIRHPFSSSITFPLLSSEETLSDGTSVDAGGIEYSTQWKRASDRASAEALHDYSPTIVNSETFSKTSALYGSGINGHVKNSWNDIINDIFQELPFDPNDQFLEEFQYAIVSSDCLNDTGTNRLPCSLGKSIMDFHKKSHSCTGAAVASIATKYGRLQVVSTNKFVLTKTLNYLETILVSFKTLRFLQKLRSNKVKATEKIVTALLIIIYVSIQQELFHLQYTKYKALITLKETLKNLQKFSSLLSKYHLKFKELSVFKTFASECIDNSFKSTLPFIRDLLSSTLDLFFYKVKIVTTNLLSVTNTTTLTKYCEIYSLHNSDLFHYLNNPAIEIEEKAKRFHILKKFTLCCLLSINHFDIRNDLTTSNVLLNFFPDFDIQSTECFHVRDTDKYNIVTDYLHELNTFIITLCSSLNGHKSVLYASEGLTSSSSSESHQEIQTQRQKKYSNDLRNCQKTSMMVNSLKRLEDTLLQSPNGEFSSETNEIVTATLEKLLTLWRGKARKNKQDTKLSPTLSSNRGFSLNVLQSSTSSILTDPTATRKAYLDSAIDFNEVEETQSDIEIDSESEDPNTIKFLQQKKGYRPKDKFQGLSDEELRGKLNEGILKFAVENNRGKERLRTQKSFELLRKATRKEKYRQFETRPSTVRDASTKYSSNMTSGSPYKLKFSSEESIPVLYEVRELLGESH
ncbi:hypothetical protein HG535_0D01410 [Zygotorulaspora mrakii]|uniref:Inheritance of peroxisomes protein 2 n=1 Tax=Zygotorulaspora mrakii TaxID=42260 RepID=A0A7H9B1M4_ZYGMR|nr:uncharacterized protein HG535_0D01410 [Zygotorulaspora mrakii]QLG72433.1 hypothetical protein HG535_0D01410 [Zygotorulaspora mrakii]